MSNHDSFAHDESRRRARYESAYASPEAIAWMNSLSPAQRERAESLGLLHASHESDVNSHSIETISANMQPREEIPAFDDHLIAAPLRNKPDARMRMRMAELLDTLGMQDAEELEAFINSDGNPRLRCACLNYLLSQGSTTCEDLAKQLGISKQAFHYHVRQIEKQLGLPPMGNQRGSKARESYRLSNRRR